MEETVRENEEKIEDFASNIPCIKEETPTTIKEAVDFLATKSALSDEHLAEEITNAKKEELKESAIATLKKEKAENKNAEAILQIANFGVYEGVANYAGIKKPLPKFMQSFLFTFLSVIQTIWLICTGVPTSIIVITADCVDVIVRKLSSIAKSARWCVVVIILLIALYCLFSIGMSLLKSHGILNY